MSIAQSIPQRVQTRLSEDSRAFLDSLSPAGSAGVLRLVAEVVELAMREDAQRRARDVVRRGRPLNAAQVARYLGCSVEQVRLDENAAMDRLFHGLIEQAGRGGDVESRGMADVAGMEPGPALERIKDARLVKFDLPRQANGSGVVTLNDVPVAIVETLHTTPVEAWFARGVAIEVFEGGRRRSVHPAWKCGPSLGRFGGAA